MHKRRVPEQCRIVTPTTICLVVNKKIPPGRRVNTAQDSCLGKSPGLSYSVWLQKKFPADFSNMRGCFCSDVLDNDLLSSCRIEGYRSGDIISSLTMETLISTICFVFRGTHELTLSSVSMMTCRVYSTVSVRCYLEWFESADVSSHEEWFLAYIYICSHPGLPVVSVAQQSCSGSRPFQEL
jgi:hypothetical protein